MEKSKDMLISDFFEMIQKDPAYKKATHDVQENHDEAYAQAYFFYTQGLYERANEIFHQLVVANPYEGKYWFCLASTLQQQKKYERALHAWALAALLDSQNALPHFHAAECLFSLKKIEDGFLALEKAVHKDPKKILHSKIEALKQVWMRSTCHQ